MLNPPFYVKYFYILGSLALTCFIIMNSTEIVCPLLAAFIFTLILKPFSANIEKKIHSRAFSSFCSVFLILTLFFFIAGFFSFHVSSVASELPTMDEKFNATLDKFQMWGSDFFGIAPQQQIEYLKNSLATAMKNSIGFIKNTLLITKGFISYLGLFIISLFCLLYYRSHLVNFLYELFQRKQNRKINKILENIELVLKRYIVGLGLVMSVIASLNTLGLLALGIPHALLFGVFASLLIVIPYVGITLGAMFPIIFAFLTKDSYWYPLGVAILFMTVQFLEGNLITPKVMGGQVKINPFAAILSLLVTGMLLGFTGIVFAVPILAIVKTICDQITPLKPLGYLISDPEQES